MTPERFLFRPSCGTSFFPSKMLVLTKRFDGFFWFAMFRGEKKLMPKVNENPLQEWSTRHDTN